MFYLIGIIISFFLCSLILLKQNKSLADKILGLWMGVLVVHQLLFYFYYSGISFQYTWLLGTTLPLPLLHGIFLFLYVSAVTNHKHFSLFKMLLHFIPFLLLTLLATPFYILSSEEKIEIFRNEGQGFEWYILVQNISVIAIGLLYVIWSFILIQKYRSRSLNIFSNLDRKNLRWLELLSIGLGVIWLLVVFFDDQIIFSGVVILVLFIGIFGINQVPVFYSAVMHEDSAEFEMQYALMDSDSVRNSISDASARYAKSGLKEDEAERISQLLHTLMRKEGLYKNSNLTLTDLAERMEVHPNYLSQVINEREEKNFFNYINTLRIKEFIRIASLPENKKYTLLALAFECGFNSKSTFNKYFKSYTGKTPSDFFHT